MDVKAMLFDNPVLTKHVRSRLRRPHLLTAIVLVVAISTCIVWAGECHQLAPHWAFVWLTWLQGGILFLMGPAQVANAVSQSKESGVLDFHRVSPQPPAATAVGFVLGAPIREWVMFACTLPFSFYCLLNGSPSIGELLQVLIIMVVSALLYHALGAVVGLVAPESRGVGGAIAILILVLNLFGSSIGFDSFIVGDTTRHALGLSGTVGLADCFYGFPVGEFLHAMIHKLPLLALLLIPVARRMRSDSTSLYQKPIAVLFLAVLAFLILGDIWNLPQHESASQGYLIAVYSLFVLGILLCTAVTPGAGQFANGVRRAAKQGRAAARPWSDLAANWLPLAGLTAIFATAGLVARIAVGNGLDADATRPLAIVIGTVSLFYFGSAKQYFDLRFRSSGGSYFVLLLFLLWLLPVAGGIVIQSSGTQYDIAAAVYGLSPLAGITLGAQAGFGGATDVVGAMVCISTSLLLAVLFAVLRLRAERNAARLALEPVTDERRTRPQRTTTA